MTTTLTLIYQACPALSRDQGHLVYARKTDGSQVFLGSIARCPKGKWLAQRQTSPPFESQEQAGAFLAQRRGFRAVDIL